jgi:hypothetical protein
MVIALDVPFFFCGSSRPCRYRISRIRIGSARCLHGPLPSSARRSTANLGCTAMSVRQRFIRVPVIRDVSAVDASLSPGFFLCRSVAAEEQKSKCADQCDAKKLQLPAVIQSVQQHQRKRGNNQSDAGSDTSPVQMFHKPFNRNKTTDCNRDCNPVICAILFATSDQSPEPHHENALKGLHRARSDKTL